MRRFFVSALLCALFSPLLAAPAAAQASFDCARAGTPTEHAICAAPRLSELDRALAGAYASARGALSAAGRAQLLEDQRAWLEVRNLCGGDAACLTASMQARLAALRGAAAAPAGRARAAAPAGLTGLYCARGGQDALVVVETGDGVAFEVSSWQDGGHYCGTPRLRATGGDGRWRATASGCSFELALTGDALTLGAAGPAEACRAFCGARASFAGLAWPLSGKTAHPDPAGISLAEEGC